MVAGAFLISGVILVAKPPFIFGGGDESYDFIGMYIVNRNGCILSTEELY